MKKFLTSILILINCAAYTQSITTIDTSYSKNGDTTIKFRITKVSSVVSTKIDTATMVLFKPAATIPPVVTPQVFNFLLDQIPLTDPDIIAPLRGANTFYNSKQAAPIPTDANAWSMDNEKRFTWSELQPTSAGVYQWSSFDAAVNSSIDKGQRFSFGIMPLESASGTSQTVAGNLVCFPTYLHIAMQSEAVKDWIAGGMWIPNWNSETYLSAWETFLKALADHINKASYKNIAYQNVISKVNILGFGNWGEWHTAAAGRGSWPAGTKATAASLLRIAKAHATAFPNTWLVSVVNAFVAESYPEVAYYLLTATNNVGRFGWSNYHLGSTDSGYPGYAENNTWTYNGFAIKDLVMNQWKYAPIAGEPMNSQAEVTLNGKVFGDIERQVRLYHVSQFNNQTNYPAAAESTTNLRAASKACGYHLGIGSGSIYGNQLALAWSNSGIAPAYEKWDVWFEIRNGSSVLWSGKSSFTPTMFLPGRKAIADTIGKFSGELYMIVKDPSGYRKPLPLTNKNRNVDGSYKICDIKF